ncbi:MAG: superinfection immunity protein [Clostridia bacterium]
MKINKKMISMIILVFIIICCITEKCFAIKSFNEVAEEYGMTPSELERSIEMEISPADIKTQQGEIGIKSMGRNIVELVILGIILLLIDLIPTVIAIKRKHTQKVAIILVNIFLGWTLIGWIGCLIWVFIDPNKNEQNNVTRNIGGSRYEDLARLQKLKESGAITDIEFEIEKQKLLR